MSRTTRPKNDTTKFIPIQEGAIAKHLQRSGRMPPVAIRILPLDKGRQAFYTDRFVEYNFTSSILVPVDAFSFKIAFDALGLPKIPVKEGDLITLEANRQPISTGIVDMVDVETDTQSGTTITITGRDLLSQFEDQDAVSLDSSPVYGAQMTIDAVIKSLSKDTRISQSKLIKKYAPKSAYLFATQPGESKLSALQRYCDGLNIVFWMSPSGNLTIGKPNTYATATGRFFLSRAQRFANVLSMRSTRNSTVIPNIIVPIWNGQETVQSRVGKEQVLYNTNAGPARLRGLGHRVPKAVVVSTPEGASPQDLSEVNFLTAAQQMATKAGQANLLQAYAKRELARQNIKELQVQCLIPGHYTDSGVPLLPDQVFRIKYDIDEIDEDMYLYQCDYQFTAEGSQRTNLFFCKQNCIVSDLRVV